MLVVQVFGTVAGRAVGAGRAQTAADAIALAAAHGGNVAAVREAYGMAPHDVRIMVGDNQGAVTVQLVLNNHRATSYAIDHARTLDVQP